MTSIKRILKNLFSKNKGFLVFSLLLFSIRWSFADHYRVPSGSMIPTIQIGDHLFVNKMAYGIKVPFTDLTLLEISPPQRGDIIVFKYPKDTSINYVKRLIALPGDNVEIKDGFVSINGRLSLAKPEEFKKEYQKLMNFHSPFYYTESLQGKKYQVKRIPQYSRQQSLKFTVPADQYFFMGDNRDNSSDSRTWGLVPRNYLKGKVKNVTISGTLNNFIPQINLNRFGKKII